MTRDLVLSAYAGHRHCGHQHNSIVATVHCLENLTRQYRAVRTFSIVEFVRQGADEVDRKVLENLHDVGRCTECGQRIVTGDVHQIGHLSDCPMVSN